MTTPRDGHPDHREMLSGWGNVAATPATVIRPVDRDELAETLRRAGPRGVIARGLGRSYGDPAQNAGGHVVDTLGVSGLSQFDVQSGVVTVDAGTTLERLMGWVVPLGWFVPVTPGTRQVTVGGAVASDIHGKNHHRVGSWSNAVIGLTLATPAHGVIHVTPTVQADLFWATAGGMGLTGIIVDVTLQLTRIETSLLSVDTDRTPDLDTTMALMDADDHRYDYSVAWIDLMSTGKAMGRSVLTRGRFASLDQLSSTQRGEPLRLRTASLVTAPRVLPPRLLNRLTVKAFNGLWYHKAPPRDRARLQSITEFFHPLDLVADWNRIYGRAGFLQWQCVVPLDAGDDLRWMVGELSTSGRSSFLAVLKRFGPGSPGPLSFPIAGWTLALDLPIDASGELGHLLDRLDRRVVEAGGRLYLAKDSRMDPALLADMYPQLAQWQKIRDQADPDGLMVSDLSRRLRLTG